MLTITLSVLRSVSLFSQPGDAIPANTQSRFNTSTTSVGSNLATGELNISINLGSISSRHINLPLSIGYNTGGIKAAQTATEFGLGWNLSGIPEITRQLNGEIDEKTKGWLSTNGSIESFRNGNDEYVSTWAADKKDVQPDIFYYTILGESGSFCFNESDEIVFLSKSNCQVSYSVFQDNIVSFTIRDVSGTQYTFDKTEYTSTGNGCNLPTSQNYVSSWKITELNHSALKVQRFESGMKFRYSNMMLSVSLLDGFL